MSDEKDVMKFIAIVETTEYVAGSDSLSSFAKPVELVLDVDHGETIHHFLQRVANLTPIRARDRIVIKRIVKQ